MRVTIVMGGIFAAGALSACSSNDYAMSACERDYARNREQATAAGALIGGAAGAAIDDRNDARGAAIGAAVGGLIGNQIAREDDPCGYGYRGYAYDDRYNQYSDRYDRRSGYYDDRGRWHSR